MITRAQQLSDSWREVKEQKQELSTLFQDLEQQLHSLSRRPAELEPKIALNMLDQAKVRAAIFTILTFCQNNQNYASVKILPSWAVCD